MTERFVEENAPALTVPIVVPLVRLTWRVTRVLYGWSWYLTDSAGRTRYSGWHWDRDGAKRAARRRRYLYETNAW